MFTRFPLSAASQVAGFVTSVVGLLVLIGWQFDIAILKSVLPGTVSMKANTAAAFLLAGLALIFLQRPSTIANALVRFCALVIALVGLLTLCQYFFGLDFGIDQILFTEPVTSFATSHPGRMAPNTALNFLMLGIVFILFTIPKFTNSFLIEFPIVFSLIITILGLAGYVTGLVELSGAATFTQMAVHTGATFIILCIGMLFTAYERQRAPITIEQKLFAGLTFTAALIIFISVLSVSGITSLVQASRGVEHTQQVMNQLGLVLSHVLEIQSGDRGFLLSGDDKYLVARGKASVNLPTLIDSLRTQIRNNPRLLDKISSLNRLVEDRIVFSDHLVSIRRTDGEEKAHLLFATGKGEAITDSIRVMIAQMIAEEGRLLQTRSEDEAHQANRTQLVIYLSLVVQVLLLAFIFFVVNRDVTGRRKAEEALKDNEQRLALALESGQMGAWDLDLIHDTAVRSLKHDQIFGYDSLLPQWGAEIFMKHVVPDDREHVQEKFQEAFANGNLFFECRIMRPDKSLRWIAAQGRAYYNEERTPVRMMGVVSDITERKDAETVLHRLNVQLDATNRELEAFSYSVSHDLRAPLRSLDGFSQALLEDYAKILDETGKDYLRRVRDASQRMAQLIDDMLNLSRVTRAEMRREVVNLSQMARAVAAELRKTQPERRVEFHITEGIVTNGDARLLRVVMDNLLGNAWKFTGKHPTATIELGMIQNDGRQTYFVRDDGAGFDMKYAGKLFGAFQRLHALTDFPGTGIGLTTVQRIIHRHGGRVWAESNVEQGTIFYFTLS